MQILFEALRSLLHLLSYFHILPAGVTDHDRSSTLLILNNCWPFQNIVIHIIVTQYDTIVWPVYRAYIWGCFQRAFMIQNVYVSHCCPFVHSSKQCEGTLRPDTDALCYSTTVGFIDQSMCPQGGGRTRMW